MTPNDLPYMLARMPHVDFKFLALGINGMRDGVSAPITTLKMSRSSRSDPRSDYYGFSFITRLGVVVAT